MSIDLIPEKAAFSRYFFKIFEENLFGNAIMMALYKETLRGLYLKIQASKNASLDFDFYRLDVLSSEEDQIYFSKYMPDETRISFIDIILVMGYELGGDLNDSLLNRIFENFSAYGVFNFGVPIEDCIAFLKRTLEKGSKLCGL